MSQPENSHPRGPSNPGRIASRMLLGGLFFLGVCLAAQAAAQDFEPKSVLEVVYSQPFELQAPYESGWRLEKLQVRSGLLVVLRVDPALVTPRDALEPVLYAGDHTVQRLNRGNESGFVVGIIPENLDLSKVPVWFGAPALPEKVDLATIRQERARAELAGVAPTLSSAFESRAQEAVITADLTSLLRSEAADLVIRYSPQERSLADAWRLPVNNR
ncbi:MAG: hypothetical protein AAF725_10180 [Acidobacteriota bacterium]